MKPQVLWFLTVTAGLASATAVSAAPASPATTKDADKLVAQGDTFRSSGQMTEALWAYRQAAKAGSIQGAFVAGKMLCDSARNGHGRERILDASEGLSDLFKAATNRVPQACAELSSVLQHGRGIQPNVVAAYAWMEIAAEKDHSYKKQLDQLVVEMKPEDVQQAQDLARQYAKGHWPTDLARPVDDGDPRLKIKGITVGGRSAMVILNRVTFTEGDTMDVVPENTPQQHPAAGSLTVTCMEIGADYVLVSVAGESHLKLLSSAKLLE